MTTDPTPPIETKSEKAQSAGKALAIGAAGVLGALAGDGIGALLATGGAQTFLELFIREPFSKRHEEWVRGRLADAFDRIEQLTPGTPSDQILQKLTTDEEFITTINRISTSAVRAHETAKLDALRNAVVNSALPGAPDMDLRSVFLRLVDDLTPTHLQILAFYDDPKAFFKRRDLNQFLSRAFTEEAMRANWSHLYELAYPEMAQTREVWHAYANHLTSENLLHSLFSSPPKKVFESATSPLGRRFLAFITDPVGGTRSDATQEETL